MAGRRPFQRDPDLRRRAAPKPGSNATSSKTRRTPFKRSPTEKHSRSAPAKAPPSDSHENCIADQEQRLTDVQRELEGIKKERSLLQRRLQAAEDYVSRNYPNSSADGSSATPPRFNFGDPNNTDAYGSFYSHKKPTSQDASEPQSEHGSRRSENVAFPLRSTQRSTTSHNANHAVPTEPESELKSQHQAIVMSRTKQVYDLIRYLKKASNSQQKYNEVRRLVAGCSDQAPPSSGELWWRLTSLLANVGSPATSSTHSLE